MEVYFALWVTLVNGDRLLAGQYQDETRCYQSAQMQRQFWLNHKPRPRRMDCEPIVLWEPAKRG